MISLEETVPELLFRYTCGPFAKFRISSPYGGYSLEDTVARTCKWSGDYEPTYVDRCIRKAKNQLLFF